MTAQPETSSEVPSGFEIVLHQSLVRPILMAGAPNRTAILAGTAGAVIGFGFAYPLSGVVAWLSLHSAAVMAARVDPLFFDALRLHLRQPKYFRC